MPRALNRLTILAAFAIAVFGCDRRDHPSAAYLDKMNADLPLLCEESHHHFGAVLGKSGRKLVHAYRMVNTTSHDIKIVELANRKPCCGEVRVGKTMLHPGDDTSVQVTISVKQEFGDIVHETVVLTEPAQPEDLVLRTTATAYPPIRIEEVLPERVSILLTSAKPKLIELNVFAYGTSAEAPLDLDRMSTRSTISVSWAGPAEAPSEDSPIIVSRRLAAWLDLAGAPGEHKAEILFSDLDQIVYRHILHWETVSAITTSPATIAFRQGNRDYRVLVRSNDQRSFCITRIECDVRGLKARAASAGSALQQVLEIQGAVDPRQDVKRGVIGIFTDRPAQGRVDLPFLLIE
jgi:hypothetical protein